MCRADPMAIEKDHQALGAINIVTKKLKKLLDSGKSVGDKEYDKQLIMYKYIINHISSPSCRCLYKENLLIFERV